jgi:hypothetical protein
VLLDVSVYTDAQQYTYLAELLVDVSTPAPEGYEYCGNAA